MVDDRLWFGTEPFVGYRVWNLFLVRDDPLLLRPIIFDSHIWYPLQVMEATCVSDDRRECNHKIPNPDHGCGLYAYKTYEDLVKRSSFLESYVARQRIFGEVYLWGRVIETEHGYRAQYGYPKTLLIPVVWKAKKAVFSIARDFTPDELKRELENRYRVPVEFVQEPKSVVLV